MAKFLKKLSPQMKQFLLLTALYLEGYSVPWWVFGSHLETSELIRNTDSGKCHLKVTVECVCNFQHVIVHWCAAVYVCSVSRISFTVAIFNLTTILLIKESTLLSHFLCLWSECSNTIKIAELLFCFLIYNSLQIHHQTGVYSILYVGMQLFCHPSMHSPKRLSYVGLRSQSIAELLSKVFEK